MRVLIGSIIAIPVCIVASILILSTTMATSKRMGRVEWYVFKRIRVGKLSFLFDFRKKYNVREQGIITPFFVMFLMAYATILAILVIAIVYFVAYFDGVAEMDLTLLRWVGICEIVYLVFHFMLATITELISKKRVKNLDNWKCKRL